MVSIGVNIWSFKGIIEPDSGEILLEDDSGALLLEDGSGAILLEGD